VEQKSNYIDPRLKRFSLALYLEGLGFNSISRVLRVSHTAVQNWIRSYGEAVLAQRSNEPAAVVEMDEMHTYIGQKKTLRGYGLLLIEEKGAIWTSLLATAVKPQAQGFGGKSNANAKAKS